ncbi:hypothetical protein SEA_RIBEYE_70 [Gordonia phage Ribeye]|uniref:Uncharacterized protein n=1 Tax=Gordonia phage Ribeye TaxID=2250417 RepID=A0A345KPI1_9CAUD|nr:hypothetical protein J1768_gp70 [Gordonia phage Ribeye]AXH44933.1 hypothetical protein SEA_RIBEYE_70 [Gordonia phage Ribeye]
MSDDDEVLSGELVPADDAERSDVVDLAAALRASFKRPDVEPPIVRPGEPRCDAQARAENVLVYGRIRMSVRAQCDLPPDHDGQHRVTMPDGITRYRW